MANSQRRSPPKRNPEAKALAGGQFQQRVVEDKRRKSDAKRRAKELREAEAGPESEKSG